ncbi:MAG: hypothetical protein AB9856_16735 [Cellulosilyticaceae bacterium]
MKKSRKGIIFGITIILILIITFFIDIEKKAQKEIFEIHALDVKDGSLILVKNNQETILIGGASADEAESVKNYLVQQNISRIDLVIWDRPTKQYTEGYNALLYHIPIDELYIYQCGKLDEQSEKIVSLLEKARCRVKKIESVEGYKSAYNKVRISPRVVQDSASEAKMAIEIQTQNLNYIWISKVNEKISKKPPEKVILKPTVLNISGEDRGSLLDLEALDLSQLDTLILGDKMKLTSKEQKKINEMGLKCQVIESKEEGTTIVYKDQGRYCLTTKRRMGLNIL